MRHGIICNAFILILFLYSNIITSLHYIRVVFNKFFYNTLHNLGTPLFIHYLFFILSTFFPLTILKLYLLHTFIIHHSSQIFKFMPMICSFLNYHIFFNYLHSYFFKQHSCLSQNSIRKSIEQLR